MADKPIEQMTFEELRKEVQSLSDTILKLKRTYEDTIYNLDDDNFSKTIVKEKNGMKAQIKMSEKEIATKVSTADMSSAISQTAQELRTTVVKYADTPNAITASSQSDMTDTDAIYKMLNNSGEYVYYYYNTLENSWTAFTDSISSVFKQTANGFELIGNTIIDGNAVITRNLTLSGNVTWDMSNSPVQTQYSINGSAWHTPMASGDAYMRMSFDGGNNWSDAVKVVGTDGAPGQNGRDGQDGQDGSDASVTPENVFNALTDSGAQQGIFAAFYKDGSGSSAKVFVNAEFIHGRIATVADSLSIGSTATQSQKRITLNSGTNTPVYISTVSDGIGGYGALKISAVSIILGSKLDLSQCDVTSWGNNAVPAVFG